MCFICSSNVYKIYNANSLILNLNLTLNFKLQSIAKIRKTVSKTQLQKHIFAIMTIDDKDCKIPNDVQVIFNIKITFKFTQYIYFLIMIIIIFMILHICELSLYLS